MTRTYDPLRGMRGNPDLLFAEDGSVKLPMLAPIALTMATEARYGNRCLSRQPTRSRARKVRDAMKPLAAERGVALEVRPSRDHTSWGVYVKPPQADRAAPTWRGDEGDSDRGLFLRRASGRADRPRRAEHRAW